MFYLLIGFLGWHSSWNSLWLGLENLLHKMSTRNEHIFVSVNLLKCFGHDYLFFPNQVYFSITIISKVHHIVCIFLSKRKLRCSKRNLLLAKPELYAITGLYLRIFRCCTNWQHKNFSSLYRTPTVRPSLLAEKNTFAILNWSYFANKW